MKNNLAKITLFSIVAAALVAIPSVSRAEDSTNTPAATKPAMKRHSTTIRGKVVSVDAAAMTFMVGTNTIAITSDTAITKAGTAVPLADIADQTVTVAYKKDGDKITATTVKIVAKRKKAAPAAP